MTAARVELVLTIIGQDRPGLVELLSRTVTEHHGNWEASRMARMAGRFAGILQVTTAPERADELVHALAALDHHGLRVVVEPAADPADDAAGARLLRIELVGNDRPGVIRDLSSALADRKINVEELATECGDAPMAGGTLLKVTAQVRVPERMTAEELRQVLESRTPDFLVDVAALGEPDDPS